MGCVVGWVGLGVGGVGGTFRYPGPPFGPIFPQISGNFPCFRGVTRILGGSPRFSSNLAEIPYYSIGEGYQTTIFNDDIPDYHLIQLTIISSITHRLRDSTRQGNIPLPQCPEGRYNINESKRTKLN